MVESGTCYAKIPTSRHNPTGFLCVARNAKVTMNLAFVFVREHLLHPKTGQSKEVSREYRSVY